MILRIILLMVLINARNVSLMGVSIVGHLVNVWFVIKMSSISSMLLSLSVGNACLTTVPSANHFKGVRYVIILRKDTCWMRPLGFVNYVALMVVSFAKLLKFAMFVILVSSMGFLTSILENVVHVMKVVFAMATLNLGNQMLYHALLVVGTL